MPLSGVRRPASDLEPAVAERVLELEPNAERIGGLRMDDAGKHRPVGGTLLDRPRHPPHETMDGVGPLRLVERGLADDVPEPV